MVSIPNIKIYCVEIFIVTGAILQHVGLSWKYTRISAYGVRLNYERTKYYAWENHPSLGCGNLISYSFSTQHLNLSTPQPFGVSILRWCCKQHGVFLIHQSLLPQP